MTSSAVPAEQEPASTEVEEVKQLEDESEYIELPTTMRAWVCSSYGNPLECISISNNAPLPILNNNNHILVRVHYASINPVDYKLAQGFLGPLSPKLPIVVGKDFSGKVVRIGSKVTKFKIGQSVYGQADHGSWADFCTVHENSCELKPENISFVEAASMPLVGVTSYQAIIINGKCNENTKLLVLGGSTACGLIAMQIATAFGCKEITCTSSSAELCEANGAQRVINYKESDWENELKNENFDIVYDCIGGEKSWVDAGNNRVIAKDGVFVSIVGDDPKGNLSVGSVMSAGAKILGRKIRGLFGYESYVLCLERATENLDDISELIVKDKLRAVLDPSSPYDFEQGLEIFEKSMAGRAKGKLVLKVFDDQNE